MRPLTIALASLLAAGAALVPTSDAAACGMFAGPRDPTLGIPAISTEQVLIVHDAENGREHFVREVRFANVKGKLGFVVPVPALPEVAKESAPFEALGKAFPFQPPLPTVRPRSFGSGGKGGLRASVGAPGSEGGGVAEPPPVELLAAKKVGSFTAFTLAARDPAALGKWLVDNGLEAPPEHQKWIAHYVKLGFFFVAFRFDAGDTELVAETVRVSFDTPVPYYPYLEPFAPTVASRGGASTRLLRSWVVTDSPVMPLAPRMARGGMSDALRVTPVTPWDAGTEYDDRKEIARALGPALAGLLPKHALLQTYADTRVSRNGYGDILFVPRTKIEPTAETRKKWEPLLPLLEPSLVAGDELVSVKP
jgi:hypothetical protein